MTQEIIPGLSESPDTLPEDMNTLQDRLIAVQNNMILYIANQIADINTTIRDLHIEFAERMQYADYDADDMINQLEFWQPGSRMAIENAIDQVLFDYDKKVTE
jgi:hypothetical protein